MDINHFNQSEDVVSSDPTLRSSSGVDSTDGVSSNDLIEMVPQTMTKGQLFRLLNQQIPLNEYQIPEYIYRADLIPENLGEMSPTLRNKFLEGAALPITFDHGYPALEETTPFWEKLPAESEDAFNAFMVYLEMPEKSQHENPVRLLPMIAEVTKVALGKVTEWCHMFYWHYRSRAYDLFLIVCHRKQREQRLMSIEGKHFQMAEKYLDKVGTILGYKLDSAISELGAAASEGGGELDELRIKDLTDIVEKLVKIQRISVGLPANGTTQIQSEGMRFATTNDQLKNIAKENSGTQTTSMRPPEMDKLLANPDDLAMMQDLIVRTQEAR